MGVVARQYMTNTAVELAVVMCACTCVVQHASVMLCAWRVRGTADCTADTLVDLLVERHSGWLKDGTASIELRA